MPHRLMFFSESKELSKDRETLTSVHKGIVDHAFDAKTGQRIGYVLGQ
jgi:hypothetical protein